MYMQARRLPRLITWVFELVPGFVAHNLFRRMDFVWNQIEQRLQTGTEGRDLGEREIPSAFKIVINIRTVSLLLSAASSGDGDIGHIIENATMLMYAGAETISTFMCGAMYYLLSNPRCLKLACAEIREFASKPEDISATSTKDLSYLHGCIMESFRMYPPGPGSLSRVVCPSGAEICGQYVPANTVVGINQWATYYSDRNFTDPDQFIPERSLATSGSQFERDIRAAVNPFGYGPRQCIAKDYALMAARMFLSRLLWQFDMELDPRSRSWNIQRGCFINYKGPLYVSFKARSLNGGENGSVAS